MKRSHVRVKTEKNNEMLSILITERQTSITETELTRQAGYWSTKNKITNNIKIRTTTKDAGRFLENVKIYSKTFTRKKI